MPKRWLEAYRGSMEDEERLALNTDIAMVEAMIQETLDRFDSGETGRVWALLRGAMRDYDAALAAGDADAMVAAIGMLGEVIRRGDTEAGARAELLHLIERRRKLVESERKRLVQQQEMIHREVAAGMMAQLVQVVKDSVDDDDAIRAIAAKFAAITGA